MGQAGADGYDMENGMINVDVYTDYKEGEDGKVKGAVVLCIGENEFHLTPALACYLACILNAQAAEIWANTSDGGVDIEVPE